MVLPRERGGGGGGGGGPEERMLKEWSTESLLPET